MKKSAFTLMETVVVLIIIGILAAVMFTNLKGQNFSEKETTAKITKVLNFIEQANSQILEIENIQCPMNAFMVKPSGATDWEFAIYNTSGSSLATTSEIINLYEKYIKYETNVLNFCDYTGYCSSNSIIGAKVSGDIYFGIEKFNSISDCSSYRMPNETTDNPAPTKFNPKTGTNDKVKCWGKLYVDINGTKDPNTYGDDVFIFNLGQYGIVK